MDEVVAMISCTPTERGNPCLGLFIGFVIAIPVYLGLAWVLSRVMRIDYGLALVVTIAMGVVSVGIIALWVMRRAKEME